MPKRDPDLHRIAEGATFLWEKLGGVENTGFNRADALNQLGQSDLLRRWADSVASGEPEEFTKRFAWDDINVSSALAAFSDQHELKGLPSWTQLVEEICGTTDAQTQFVGTHNQKNQPFGALFGPILQVARTRLQRRNTDRGTWLLSDDGLNDLEFHLIKRLSNLSSSLLYSEFCDFRPVGVNLAVLMEDIGYESSTFLYEAFVQSHLQDRLTALLQKYPVWARLISTETLRWIDRTAEFVERVAIDLPILSEWYPPAAEKLERIVSVTGTASDPHDGGGTVQIATFNNGWRIVYKPRDISIEEKFFNFLALCNKQHPTIQFRIPRTLSGAGYGWMEYVEPSECRDVKDVSNFYRNSGALLCVLYLLGATDCHSENIIASGVDPVLVDVECLLHAEAIAIGADDKVAFDSVLRTGYLPRFECRESTTTVIDSGGLGCSRPQMVRLRRWSRANTDNMHFGWEDASIFVSRNHMPRIGGKPFNANLNTASVLAGFKEMYDHLRLQTADLLEPLGPLSNFRNQNVRFIFRPTATYYKILHNACSADSLGSGITFGLKLELLAFPLLSSESRPLAWHLLKAEFRALGSLDIPRFSMNASNRHIESGNLKLDDFFYEAGYDGVSRRISSMCDDDLNRQMEIIAASMSPVLKPAHIGVRHSAETHESDVNFIHEAELIGRRLLRRSINTANGDIDWLAQIPIDRSLRFRLALVDYGLYEGRCGIALFFAALSALTDNPIYSDAALRTLAPIRRLLKMESPSQLRRLAKRSGPGIGTGLGSLIYSFSKITKLLSRSGLEQDTAQIVALLNATLIENDQKFDLMHGVAGAIIALLESSGSSQIASIADACAEHLINHRVQLQPGRCGWRSEGQRHPLTGFSHGAAGIGLALLRLFEATGDSRYRRFGLEAWAYENDVFSARRKNWPDFRFDPPRFSFAWCHGSPGIGLSRITAHHITSDPHSEAVIETSLAATRRALARDRSSVDHVCCGTFGLLEYILVVAQSRDSTELLLEARSYASKILRARRLREGFRLAGDSSSEPFYSPTFFQGEAGIGYTLLRLAHPSKLRSVLAWD